MVVIIIINFIDDEFNDDEFLDDDIIEMNFITDAERIIVWF